MLVPPPQNEEEPSAPVRKLMSRLDLLTNRELAAEVHRALVILDDALCRQHSFSRKGKGRHEEEE